MTTIQEHCCGADRHFDAKNAKKQYRQYLKKGPSRVTKKLIGQLKNLNTGTTLLDVGGGIGAIQWWFLNLGGTQTIGVDASSGYTVLAQEHAAKNNLQENTRYLIGDFTANEDEIPLVDHITLDKVICCYPDYKAILMLACKKSTHTLSLSYPMDGFIAEIFRGFTVLSMKIMRNPFKPYIHRVASVRELIVENGFTLNEHALAFPWHIETYVKD